MKQDHACALLIGAAALPAVPAAAQDAAALARPIAGTRLDISATGRSAACPTWRSSRPAW